MGRALIFWCPPLPFYSVPAEPNQPLREYVGVELKLVAPAILERGAGGAIFLTAETEDKLRSDDEVLVLVQVGDRVSVVGVFREFGVAGWHDHL